MPLLALLLAGCSGEKPVDTGCDAPATWYTDVDGDGFGNPEAPTTACQAPAGTVADASDCDDLDNYVHPGADEHCDGRDEDCDGTVDEDPVETSTLYADADGDHYGAGAPVQRCVAPGLVAVDGDCDDDDDTVHPGAYEHCDGRDEDCDGTVDDDAVEGTTWYTDGDGDGYGDPGSGAAFCAPPDAGVLDATDCDDAAEDVHPGASEHCDGRDEDCDGSVDNDTVDTPTWYADADGDGYGNASRAHVGCDAPEGTVADGTDCADGDASVHPGADEYCNGGDDDCDGTADEAAVDADRYYADDDGDGYGDPRSATRSCHATPGAVLDDSDCDDGDATVYPGATELCDDRDADCDGSPVLGLNVPGDYPTISEALEDIIDGQTICVAAGTYYEAPDLGNLDVTVLGAGVGSTVLQLDGGPVVMGAGTLRGLTLTGGQGSPYNTAQGGLAEGVLSCIDAAGSPLLDHVSIHANISSSDTTRGLVYLDTCNLTLRDVEMDGNSVLSTSVSGGLVYGTGSSITMDGVNIHDNIVMSLGLLDGGLLSVDGGAQAWTDVQLNANEVTAGTDGSGGLVRWANADSVLVSDLVLQSNRVIAPTLTGGLLRSTGSNPTVDRVDGRANTITGVVSGGLYAASGGEHVTLSHLLWAGNTVYPGATDGWGGALTATDDTSGGTFQVTFADFYANDVGEGTMHGGVAGFRGGPSSVDFQMVTFASNASDDPVQGSLVYATDTSVTFGWCDIWDSQAPAFEGVDDPTGADGNVGVDPGYTRTDGDDPTTWDLTLGPDSPLRDAGDPSIHDSDGSTCSIGAYGG